MSEKYYTSEKGTQCLISLLKAHGIKKIIVSPGTTNHVFVGSVQSDEWFEVYSSVDERSAAYIACGMAAQSGEPVVITCTGATASRNYLSGLTEAYYRKLPVIAVTYNAGVHRKGHLIAQQIDRDRIQKDVSRLAVSIPLVKDEADAWFCNVELNKALLAARHRGGGPVHIDISTSYSRDFSVKELPAQRVIRRVGPNDRFPEMPAGKIAVFVGAHKNFTEKETEAIDKFCRVYNAVVLCDHTSGYYGKYRIQSSLIGGQKGDTCLKNIRVLVHLGEVSGDYYTMPRPQEVWRVNVDGEIKDTFRTLRYVFEMEETAFFDAYASTDSAGASSESLLEACRRQYEELHGMIPELPFGNIWIAQHSAHRIPAGSVVHLGILNTLRSWNFFRFGAGVETYCNVGGFGIDGILSTVAGASMASPDTLFFAVLGDLAFFYDVNVLGNRHMGNNLRIMVVNNGRGTEFTNYNHPCHQFGDEAVPFMAAGGHFGRKSPDLVRHMAADLGFGYLSANSKEEFETAFEKYLSRESEKSIVFEVFTDPRDESDALQIMLNLRNDAAGTDSSLVSVLKNGVRRIVGDKGRRIIDIIRE